MWPILKITGLLFSAAEAVPGLSGVVELTDRGTARRISRELAALMFWTDGMRAILGRIASGNGSQSDLDELAVSLRKTQDEAVSAFNYLHRNRGTKIAALFGTSTASKIDAVVFMKMGPGAIRNQIMNIVEAGDLSPASAQSVLFEIEEFVMLIEEIDTRI